MMMVKLESENLLEGYDETFYDGCKDFFYGQSLMDKIYKAKKLMDMVHGFHFDNVV